jgi:3-dehydroquinate synthase
MPQSHSVRVNLESRSYDVLIGSGILTSVGEQAKELFGARKCAVVTDSHVAPLYGEVVKRSLAGQGIESVMICVSAGEKSKSMAVVEDVCRQMLRAGLDRKGFLVALGGGVIGDLAGFAASIFLRGIPFLQVPTTVLSQVDSSVGGKTGVNTPEGKNLLGTFSQPARVLADTDTLQSLPPREYREGFAEIIKHAAIRDASMMDAINKASRREGDLAALIQRNVAIKARIVEADEYETLGQRALLNFGHTIGHAIEASVPYGELLHGEAISLGMVAAARMSAEIAGLPAEHVKRIVALLEAFELPTRLPQSITSGAIIEHMKHDKKFSEGKIRFVLLRSLGDAFVTKDVTPEQIEQAIEQLRH